MIKSKEDFVGIVKEYEKEISFFSYFHLIFILVLTLPIYFFIFNANYILMKLALIAAATCLIIRMFIMFHDYAHRAIFKRDNLLVRVIFLLYGIYIFFPLQQWSRSHDSHHAKNSILNLGSDSIKWNYLDGYFSVVDKYTWSRLNPSDKRLYKFRRSFLAIFFGSLVFFVMPTISRIFTNFRANYSSLLSLSIHTLLNYFLYVNFGAIGILFHILPLFFATAIGSYIFYAQHNFPEAQYVGANHWNYIDSALNATSHFHMNSFMHWVTGNIGFHHVHHLNSKIPFYALPVAHKRVSNFVTVNQTTWSIRDLKKNFNCNIWDEDLNKFISYSDLK